MTGKLTARDEIQYETTDQLCIMTSSLFAHETEYRIVRLRGALVEGRAAKQTLSCDWTRFYVACDCETPLGLRHAACVVS